MGFFSLFLYASLNIVIDNWWRENFEASGLRGFVTFMHDQRLENCCRISYV